MEGMARRWREGSGKERGEVERKGGGEERRGGGGGGQRERREEQNGRGEDDESLRSKKSISNDPHQNTDRSNDLPTSSALLLRLYRSPG